MGDSFGYGEIVLDINPCRGCDDYDAPDGCKSNGGCGKPITNADRIRAMSDEELAEFFAQQKYRKPVFDGWLPLCNHVMGSRMCHENGCVNCWLNWLKSPAGGDGDG